MTLDPDPLIVGWMLLSLVGFLFALFDAVSALGNYTLVKQGWPENERLREYTLQHSLSQWARATKLFIYLLIGLAALAEGPPILIILGLFASNIIVVAAAIRSNVSRRRLFGKTLTFPGTQEERDSDRRTPPFP